jgi:hypothetical protein
VLHADGHRQLTTGDYLPPMSILLTVAGALAIGVAAAHSLLGERYVVRRLLRRDDLPRLFGGQEFTRRTIRFAWHLTSIAWVGLGAVLLVLASDTPPPATSLVGDGSNALAARVAGVTFIASAVVTATASRFRHLAWIVFLVIGVFALAG